MRDAYIFPSLFVRCCAFKATYAAHGLERERVLGFLIWLFSPRAAYYLFNLEQAMTPNDTLAKNQPKEFIPTNAHLLQWSLFVVFLWFGAMKFTSYEAQGITPFIANSPVMSWLHSVFGVRGASEVIGAVELTTAAALATGAFNRVALVLGSVMSCATYAITLTFFLSTPGVAESTAGGFPAISAPIGQFLLKDVVLLAASIVLLRTTFASLRSARS